MSGATTRIVDGALDALITVDGDQRIVDLNPATEQLFGMSREDVIGEDMSELIVPPESRVAQRAAFARATTGSDPRLHHAGAVRLEAMRVDGRRFPLELTLSRTSEEPLQITAWLHDRTREVVIERRASLSERVEEAVGAGSWELDVTRNIAVWSDSLFRMFGYEPGEVEASVDLALKHAHPDDRDRVRGEVQKMIDTGNAEPYEYRAISVSGEVLYLRVLVALSETDEHRTVVFGAVRNITEQRAAQRRASFLGTIVDWTTRAGEIEFERGIDLLLALVAGEAEALAASFWVPRGGVLRCHATWASEAIDSTKLDRACGEIELPPGAGVPGRAYSGEGMYLKPGGSNDHLRQKAIAEIGLRGAVAFPAVHMDEVIAVVEILLREMPQRTAEGTATMRAGGLLIGEFLSHRRGHLDTTSLTKRELQILQLAAEGFPGPKIAEELVISPATVKSHFEHIYPKLEVTDRGAAVAAGLRLGLIR